MDESNSLKPGDFVVAESGVQGQIIELAPDGISATVEVFRDGLAVGPAEWTLAHLTKIEPDQLQPPLE